jgi:hypothetical protein
MFLAWLWHIRAMLDGSAYGFCCSVIGCSLMFVVDDHEQREELMLLLTAVCSARHTATVPPLFCQHRTSCAGGVAGMAARLMTW